MLNQMRLPVAGDKAPMVSSPRKWPTDNKRELNESPADEAIQFGGIGFIERSVLEVFFH